MELSAVSPSQVQTVERYIHNQAEHHRTKAFEQDFHFSEILRR
jgi:hypothetical protein